MSGFFKGWQILPYSALGGHPLSCHARSAGMSYVNHWIPRPLVPNAALPVSSPQVVYMNQIGETGTIRQRLYMQGDSNEHSQER